MPGRAVPQSCPPYITSVYWETCNRFPGLTRLAALRGSQ